MMRLFSPLTKSIEVAGWVGHIAVEPSATGCAYCTIQGVAERDVRILETMIIPGDSKPPITVVLHKGIATPQDELDASEDTEYQASGTTLRLFLLPKMTVKVRVPQSSISIKGVPISLVVHGHTCSVEADELYWLDVVCESFVGKFEWCAAQASVSIRAANMQLTVQQGRIDALTLIGTVVTADVQGCEVGILLVRARSLTGGVGEVGHSDIRTLCR